VSEQSLKREQRAIRQVYESWFRAMESGDVAGIVSLVTPDVVVEMPGYPPNVGRDALEAALREFHASYSETVQHEVEEIEIHGHLAFVRLSEKITIRSKSDGVPFTVDGTHHANLHRQPGGAWLVARDVASVNAVR